MSNKKTICPCWNEWKKLSIQERAAILESNGLSESMALEMADRFKAREMLIGKTSEKAMKEIGFYSDPKFNCDNDDSYYDYMESQITYIDSQSCSVCGKCGCIVDNKDVAKDFDSCKICKP
jgi:hypothetical protein